MFVRTSLRKQKLLKARIKVYGKKRKKMKTLDNEKLGVEKFSRLSTDCLSSTDYIDLSFEIIYMYTDWEVLCSFVSREKKKNNKYV